MRRHLAGSALITLSLAGAVACTGPQATNDLAYDDINAMMLAETTLVVATSRQGFTSHMLGSTLLIDPRGRGKRIDNDGMDSVSLAVDGTTVGFSDIRHDYLLGTERPVRPRASNAPGIAYSSHLYQGRLISLFNGGFAEDGYALTIAEGDTPPRTDHGYVMSTAQCADGVWAAINDDPAVAPSSRVDIRRLTPESDRAWTMGASGGTLEFQTMTCQGRNIIAVGTLTDEDELHEQVLGIVDVGTGASRIVKLDRPKAIAPETASPLFAAAMLDSRYLYVAQTPPDSAGRVELWRIDPETGRNELVASVEGVDEYSDLQVRFDGNLLYVLDPTEDEPSVLTAINVDSGKTVGRLEMDPLNDMVNGLHTSFEDTQFVRDFVVLQPPEKW